MADHAAAGLARERPLFADRGRYRPKNELPASELEERARLALGRGAADAASRGNGARGPEAGGPASKKSAPERALSLFMIAAAIVALAALAVALAPSTLVVSRIEIEGASSMTESELLELAALRRGDPFFSVDAARSAEALESDPRIASAKVRKILPNAIALKVVERKPAAAAIAEAEGHEVAVLIDAEGVAYAIASAGEAASVPALSGLRFENFRLGTRLPASLLPLLKSLGEISASEPALLSAFSELRVAKRAKGDPELILYPIGSRIPVRAGSSISAESLRSMIMVLDVLGSNGVSDSVEELDFRSGSVVYRGKEDHSG